MNDRSISKKTAQRYARTCGLFYLYIIAVGIFAELFVRSRLIVVGDAAATATNIRAHESLFRIGFSAELLHIAFDVAIAVMLYALLKPVDRNVALLAAFFRLAADIILAITSLTHFVVLRLLVGAETFGELQTAQMETLALLAMQLHGDGYSICLLFFGFACMALGYVIGRSGYLPRLLGVAMAIAGVCYVFHSFAQFLNPTFASRLFPPLFVPIFVAELSLALWLAVKGVNAVAWETRAGRGTGSARA